LFSFLLPIFAYLVFHSGGLMFVALIVGIWIDVIRFRNKKEQTSGQQASRGGRGSFEQKRIREEIFRAYQKRAEYVSDMPTILMALSAAVMKADGRKLKVELEFVKQYLLSQVSKDKTLEYLQKLKQYLDTELPLTQICADASHGLPLDTRIHMVQFFFLLAQSDGEIAREEYSVIYSIAVNLGVPHSEFETLKQKYYYSDNKKPKNDHYTTLGLDKTATLQQVKEAYRKLSKQYHPDTVAHKGEYEQQKAKEQFQKIQAAYQAINKKVKN